MRIIKARDISRVVSELAQEANFVLRKDVWAALKEALRKETNQRARSLWKAIIENATLAKNQKLAICQDTGLPIVFVELGQDVKIEGNLKVAIIKGIAAGYKKGYLRNSIVAHPLKRGRPCYRPPIIHIDIIKGTRLKLTVLPKGFGCENKSKLKMFEPTADTKEIKQFILDSVKEAGPDACPPFIVGVGIGGTADYAMLLAKKALLQPIRRSQALASKRLEKELLRQINQLNIGPMGLGGRTTCLGVNIETYPTHIAGLPVAVNISCHALRSASKII
ncbi:MAG: fumarate hydratase [Candidatus Omnitrophica bacterium]|nr:fumarate hydratase [Candidatus Omnitrophota bacterium]